MTVVPRRLRGQLPTKAPSPSKGSVIVSGDSVSLCVFGRPAPQGSKTPLGREDNYRTRPWREMIVEVLKGLPAGWVPLDGPLQADFTFLFNRPKTVTSAYPTTRSTYDYDKLLRAADDAFTTGGLWVDDARVVDGAAHKRWTDGEERMVVLVSPLRVEG